jgi:hypothetical protein
MIVHVVLVRWNRRAMPERIAKARSDFLALASGVPGIVSAYWADSSIGRNSEFDGGVVVLARDEQALAAYNASPGHTELAQLVDSMTAKYAAADLRARDTTLPSR